MFTRFLIFCAFCICLVFYSLTIDLPPKLEIIGAGEYCFYIVGRAPKSSLIEKVINNMVYCKSENAAELRGLLKNIKGESLRIENCNTDILKTLNYQKINQGPFGIYAYSTRASNFVRIGGKKVNLQIAVRGNVTTIGFPVILGSF